MLRNIKVLVLDSCNAWIDGIATWLEFQSIEVIPITASFLPPSPPRYKIYTTFGITFRAIGDFCILSKLC